MIEAIDEIKLARLNTEFVVPLIVSYMLQGLEPLDEVAELTLHEMLSELAPDAAVLCIALSSQHVAARNMHTSFGQALAVESERLVQDYGPLWLAHAGGQALNDEIVHSQLTYLPEDCEAMSHLLDGLHAMLGESDPVLSALTEIFSIQAQVHGEYAESELKMLELSYLHPEDDKKPRQAASDGSNVIKFPLKREAAGE